MSLTQITYPGGFMEFMSLIFDIYSNKWTEVQISRESEEVSLFNHQLAPAFSAEKAERVLSGLMRDGGKKSLSLIYRCFLSELPGIEDKLLYLIRLIFKKQTYKIADFSDPIILELHQTIKKIGREVHRMHAFVRFQETKDGIWACEINPDFDVLPLIGKHFKDRYPAFEWMIFDTIRGYGIYYKPGKGIDTVKFEDYNQRQSLIGKEALTEDELAYQAMWKQYFESVNIKERNNKKLHLRHVPKRYWKYLIEKQ